MTRPHFHEELEKMELRLLTLGELSGNAVQRAVEAVMQHDDDAAEAASEVMTVVGGVARKD